NIAQFHGKKLLEDIGSQPYRQLGFISVATRQLDGNVVLISQSVDNSNEEAFLAVELAVENGVTNIDVLLNVYDEVLGVKLGKHCRAGRLPHQQHEDAWRLLQDNQQLAEYLYVEIERLAMSPMPRNELLDAKKRLTYGVWAAFKKRLDASVLGAADSQHALVRDNSYSPYIHEQLQREVLGAFEDASAKGEVLLACGGSIGGGIMDANANDVRDMIFGSDRRKERTEVMKCVHCPLCKRSGVDATIKYASDHKTITCSKCKQSKSYKR
ncbi:MAG: hypothetical protein AAB459_01645, partial [Patescibacteria group bacterium]